MNILSSLSSVTPKSTKSGPSNQPNYINTGSNTPSCVTYYSGNLYVGFTNNSNIRVFDEISRTEYTSIQTSVYPFEISISNNILLVVHSNGATYTIKTFLVNTGSSRTFTFPSCYGAKIQGNYIYLGVSSQPTLRVYDLSAILKTSFDPNPYVTPRRFISSNGNIIIPNDNSNNIDFFTVHGNGYPSTTTFTFRINVGSNPSAGIIANGYVYVNLNSQTGTSKYSFNGNLIERFTYSVRGGCTNPSETALYIVNSNSIGRYPV